MPPNFYYDQEDYLVSKVKGGAKWTWTASRPNPVCGFAIGNPMNIVTSIGVYGTICKELGLPLRFPGTEKAFDQLLEVIDVELLAKAMVYFAEHSHCANQAFNVSNGDVFRWSSVWPSIAKFFDLAGEGRPVCPISLSVMMTDKKPLWNSIVKKYGLKPIPFEEITLWGFADWVFVREYDWFCNVNKARRAGFNEMVVETEEMFLRQLRCLRDDKIIP